MRILVISHDSSRTGAPLVLIRLLRWLRDHTDHELCTVVAGPGPMADDFRALGSVIELAPRGMTMAAVDKVWPGAAKSWHERRLAGILGRLGEFDVVYSNTVMNGQILRVLGRASPPVISHVHELDHWIQHHVDPVDWRTTRTVTKRWIAVSRGVRENLVRAHGVDAADVTVVYPFLEANDAQGAVQERSDARNALGVPRDALVVGGCGTLDWRKGPDVFVTVASLVAKRLTHVPMSFLWIGGGRSTDVARLEHDVRAAGLSSIVRFLGPAPDAARLFHAFDVFALTSREDPYPLVMLENALARNPTVCFEGAGAAVEFVEDDAGIAVPFLDVEAFAEAIVLLLGDADSRTRLGETGRQKVLERHDVDHACEQILRAIEGIV